MKRSLTIVTFVVLGLLSAGLAGLWPRAASGFKSGVFEPARAAPDFSIQGSDGGAVSLARFRGKVILLEFGFTHCEKVCPATLGKLTHVFDKLGDAARDVQLVFVTVDPERDDVRRLREFLGIFDSRFIGATGSTEQIDALQRAYGVLAAKEAAPNGAGYGVHHSSSLYLIDRRGVLRALVPFGMPAEEVVHDIQLVLNE